MAGRKKQHSQMNKKRSKEGRFFSESNQTESSEEIIDNAKRSVSFRISSMDYGRIKTIARRKKTRESEVVRYLLRTSLNALGPVSSSEACNRAALQSVTSENLSALATLEENLRQTLGKEHLFSLNDAGAIESYDTEMLALAVQPLRYLAEQLSQLIDKPVEASNAVCVLQEYLECKYRKEKAPSSEEQNVKRDFLI